MCGACKRVNEVIWCVLRPLFSKLAFSWVLPVISQISNVFSYSNHLSRNILTFNISFSIQSLFFFCLHLNLRMKCTNICITVTCHSPKKPTYKSASKWRNIITYLFEVWKWFPEIPQPPVLTEPQTHVSSECVGIKLLCDIVLFPHRFLDKILKENDKKLINERC